MRTLPLLVALASAAVPLFAQANCSVGPGPATSFATMTPFAGGNLYGHPNYPNAPGPSYTGFTFLFDLTLNVQVAFSQVDISLYDDGGLVNLGNNTTTTSPNQIGATALVEWYVVPLAAWAGNELTPASWGLVGTGTLTVGGAWGVHSPAVFNTPVTLPPGLWGSALVIYQTTTGPNPGPLHPMLDVSLTTVPAPYANGVMSITNVQFQRESWTATLAPVVHRQNLEWHYTPVTGYASWTSFGSGCGTPAAPVLALAARPVVGTTLDFRTTNIPANTAFNFWLFGFQASAGGLNLAPFGMPGCSLYLPLGSPIVTNISSVTAGLANISLAVPLDPSYSGIVLFGQAAPMTPGLNAAGFLASNAVCVAIGLY